MSRRMAEVKLIDKINRFGERMCAYRHSLVLKGQGMIDQSQVKKPQINSKNDHVTFLKLIK
jgi:hypothetical protein